MDMVDGQEKKNKAAPMWVLSADNLMGRYRRNRPLTETFADRTKSCYRRIGIISRG